LTLPIHNSHITTKKIQQLLFFKSGSYFQTQPKNFQVLGKLFFLQLPTFQNNSKFNCKGKGMLFLLLCYNINWNLIRTLCRNFYDLLYLIGCVLPLLLNHSGKKLTHQQKNSTSLLSINSTSRWLYHSIEPKTLLLYTIYYTFLIIIHYLNNQKSSNNYIYISLNYLDVLSAYYINNLCALVSMALKKILQYCHYI